MKVFKHEKRVKFLSGECFYGGIVRHGTLAPYTALSNVDYSIGDTIEGDTFGGVFVSNAGRFLRLTGGDCRYVIKDGEIALYYDGELLTGDGYGTLKGALDAVYKTVEKDEKKAPRYLLTRPQFCTWTDMDVNVSEKKITDYLERVAEYGFPHDGVFIIDDGWMTEYGDWSFDKNKFQNPRKTVDRAHALGFKVSLWLVPFVNESAKDYNLLAENGGLIKNADGTVYKRKWWNGESALLDMTSPFTITWFTNALDGLIKDYGVDGFKFDGGGTRFYIGDGQRYYKDVDCVGQSRAWAEFAARYELSELKEYSYYPFRHYITRLNDKRRIWDENEGIGSLVPNMINAGLCGCLYTCADMIGGGQISDFRFRAEEVDEEVIKRFCECSALMPCMQFSHSYWNENDDIGRHFLKFAKLHESFAPYIGSLIDEAENFGRPILRSLEYEFPHQGLERVRDAFMLGSKYLVAPVTTKGAVTKTVTLPKGCDWVFVPENAKFRGGEKVVVNAPVGTLPYFEKI